MSILSPLFDGSLLSSERLMRAREFYAPDPAAVAGRPTLASWTKRVPVQSELASARELAGLSDAELTSLEAEFQRCQMRPRSAWQRHASLIGVVFVVLAACALAAPALVVMGELLARLLQTIGVALLLVGMIALGSGFLGAFANVHLDLSYGTLGLYVGQLDERHPWLYKTLAVVRHPAVDEYRIRVLTERGLLRGADYVVMREIARAQEALDQMRPARAVAEELQLLPPPELADAPPPVHVDGSASEPRLVSIKSSALG